MHYKKYAQLPHEEKWNGFTLDYKYIEGFSPLFYATEGTHWDLDHDADNFLYDVISRYWVWDFVSPETTYIRSLLEAKDEADRKTHDLVKYSVYFQTSRADRDFFAELEGKTVKSHPHKVEFDRLFNISDDLESRIYRAIPALIREVIKDDYVYDGPIDKQGEYDDTPYNHAIIREPGKYLYHYINDQMVFDNYVQNITAPRIDPEVVALLDSGVLLEPIVRDRFWLFSLDEVTEVVANNYRGWWT